MDKQPDFPRIFISRTEKEWEAIQKIADKMNVENLNSFINASISSLQKEYKRSPSQVCRKISRRVQKEYKIYPKHINILNILSVKTGLPISTIVDRAIIEPLILNK